MAGTIDETSPLLFPDPDNGISSSSQVKTLPKKTPLPKVQFGVLILVNMAEPITAFCIFPFINQVSYYAYRLYTNQTHRFNC